MKIERLKQKSKKPIIIGTILTVVIGGALTFKLTHSKYRVTQSIDLGSGTINYKVPDFKIMAMYKNDGSGDVSIDSMPSGLYVINEEKTYCQTSSGTQVKGKIKTVNGIHGISGLNKGDKCYLYFDKKTPENITELIASLNAKTSTPTFSSVAKTDEGVYSTSDGMYSGTTYYWRGAATTNHVIFANKCWRIVRINGDKTMRLIYNGGTVNDDGKTCADFGSGAVVYSGTTSDRYYATSDGQFNNASYVGWTYSLGSQRTLGGTASNVKTQTENWYKDTTKGNLTAYESKIADGKYCNDRDTEAGGSSGWSATGSEFNYAGYKRLLTNRTPTFSCPGGDVYTLKVGAITADEVAFAGGVYGQNNASYYLKGDNNYWTMSPSRWNGGYAYVFRVDSNGRLSDWSVGGTSPGLRPVINLKADTQFASNGTGTKSNPYTVSTSSGGQTSSSK